MTLEDKKKEELKLHAVISHNIAGKNVCGNCKHFEWQLDILGNYKDLGYCYKQCSVGEVALLPSGLHYNTNAITGNCFFKEFVF